jgi:hypothetical protein
MESMKKVKMRWYIIVGALLYVISLYIMYTTEREQDPCLDQEGMLYTCHSDGGVQP